MSNICDEWQNFVIRIVQDSDIPHILNFLVSNFHLDEPIGQNLPRDDQFIQNTNEKIGALLKSHPGLSFVAFDKETQEVAGVQLVFIWKKEDADAEKAQFAKRNEPIYLQRKVMNAIYAPMKKTQLQLFDRYEVTEIA